MTDLDELERLAKAASPGPWHSPGLGEVHDDLNNRVILDVCWPEEGVDISDSFSGGKQEDADFVACANPATILALTAEVRRLRADLSTPVLTQFLGGAWSNQGMDGLSHKVVEAAFSGGTQIVNVYYGEKRIYTSMAAFRAANPKEGV